MKNCNSIIALAAALLLSGCAKEQNIPVTEAPLQGGTTTISVHAPETTKSVIGSDGLTILWAKGDKIKVNDVNSVALTEEEAGRTSATFTFNSPLTPPYYALSNYAKAYSFNLTSSPKTVRLNLESSGPSTYRQTYTEGSYDTNFATMLGYGTEAIVFRHIMSYIKVIPKLGSTEASIYSVSINDPAGAQLSGRFIINLEDGSLSAFTGDDDKYVPVNLPTATMVKDGGVALTSEGSAWIVAIPAGTYASGLRIKIQDTEGRYMGIKTSGSFTAEAGFIYPLEATYAPNGILAPAATATEVSSSTVSFTWTHGLGTAYDLGKAYTVALYDDSECASAVQSYDIPASHECWSSRQPKFCFGGLSPETTYYFKVTNTTDSKTSEAVSATTSAFTPVTIPGSPVDASFTGTLLAEDFGEVAIGGENVIGAAGASGSTLYKMGDEAAVNFSNFSRLSDWNSANIDAGNRKPYMHQGHFKLGTGLYSSWILTPVLSAIPDRYTATLSVKVTASRYDASSTSSAIIAAISKTGRVTAEDFSSVQNITLGSDVAWKEYEVTLSGITNTDRIAFGPATDIASGKGRMHISDITVEVTALSANVPQNLAASSTYFSETTLSWNAVAGADSYNVYRDGTKIASGVTATTYHATDLTVNTSYAFTVTSVKDGDESDQSAAATTTTLNVEAVSIGRTQACFKWDRTSTQNDLNNSYVLAVYKDAKCTNALFEKAFTAEPLLSQYSPYGTSRYVGQSSGNGVRPSELRASFGNLAPSTTYYFRVRPVTDGESGSTFTFESTSYSLTNTASGAAWSSPVAFTTLAAHSASSKEVLYCGFDAIAVGPDMANIAPGVTPSKLINASNADEYANYLGWTISDTDWFTWTVDRCINKTVNQSTKLGIAKSGTYFDGSATHKLYGSTDRECCWATHGDVNGWDIPYSGPRMSLGQIILYGAGAYVSTPQLTSNLQNESTATTCTLSVDAASIGNTGPIGNTTLKVHIYSGGTLNTTAAATISIPYNYAPRTDANNYMNDFTPTTYTCEISLKKGDAVVIASSSGIFTIDNVLIEIK